MSEQNYQNHTRWYPLFHFVLMPLLLINLIWAITCVVMHFDWYRVQYLLMSVIVLLLTFGARLQALKAQDRTIRLEERLRFREVLSDDLAKRASKMSPGKIIALRFASDDELPALIERVLSGELNTGKEIKLAIKNWRADHHRV